MREARIPVSSKNFSRAAAFHGVTASSLSPDSQYEHSRSERGDDTLSVSMLGHETVKSTWSEAEQEFEGKVVEMERAVQMWQAKEVEWASRVASRASANASCTDESPQRSMTSLSRTGSFGTCRSSSFGNRRETYHNFKRDVEGMVASMVEVQHGFNASFERTADAERVSRGLSRMASGTYSLGQESWRGAIWRAGDETSDRRRTVAASQGQCTTSCSPQTESPSPPPPPLSPNAQDVETSGTPGSASRGWGSSSRHSQIIQKLSVASEVRQNGVAASAHRTPIQQVLQDLGMELAQSRQELMHSFKGSQPGLPQPLHEVPQPTPKPGHARMVSGHASIVSPGHARIVSYDRVWRARDERHGPGSSHVSATSSAVQRPDISHRSEHRTTESQTHHRTTESPPSVHGSGRSASPGEAHRNVQLLEPPACQEVDLSVSAENAAVGGDGGVWTMDDLREENRRLTLVIEREREALAREEGVNAGMRVRNKELDLDRRRWQRMYEDECCRCEEAKVLADSMAADSLRAKGFIEAEIRRVEAMLKRPNKQALQEACAKLLQISKHIRTASARPNLAPRPLSGAHPSHLDSGGLSSPMQLRYPGAF